MEDKFNGAEAECGAYYGTGRPGPGRAAVCRRPAGHPPISEDGIGHNPYPVPVNQEG